MLHGAVFRNKSNLSQFFCGTKSTNQRKMFTLPFNRFGKLFEKSSANDINYYLYTWIARPAIILFRSITIVRALIEGSCMFKSQHQLGDFIFFFFVQYVISEYLIHNYKKTFFPFSFFIFIYLFIILRSKKGCIHVCIAKVGILLLKATILNFYCSVL